VERLPEHPVLPRACSLTLRDTSFFSPHPYGAC
jgi:hypothetical protein